MNKLGQVSVLMKFSGGVPGTSRKDKRTTEEVKVTKHLGKDAGKWIADLYPPEVLDPVKKKIAEARTFHAKVTFPFGVAPDESEAGEDNKAPAPIAGIGILPAAMIQEYTDTMRQFSGELAKLADDFLQDPQKYVDWAMLQHNGTFDPKNYPGCTRLQSGEVVLDVGKFREVMRKRIYLRTEPLPVPDSEQFSAGVMSLLGVDAQSVDLRVRDAGKEAQRELLARMQDPVLHMASKLAGVTCNCRACKGRPAKTGAFRDTLVQNIRDIASLVPKLNLDDDPNLNGFAQEMQAALGSYEADSLRDDESKRKEAADKAQALFKKMSGYKL